MSTKDNKNNKHTYNGYFKNHNKFAVAFKGIATVLKEESSFRYQTLIFFLVVSLGFILHITAKEWISIILSTMLVLSLEIMNTSIENIVDLVSEDYHPLAGKIKDIAAGAVLLASIGAVLVGIIIFYPRILEMI